MPDIYEGGAGEGNPQPLIITLRGKQMEPRDTHNIDGYRYVRVSWDDFDDLRKLMHLVTRELDRLRNDYFQQTGREK